MADQAPSAERGPIVGGDVPSAPVPAVRNVAKRRAWIGFWIGLLDIAFWGYMAWGPANEGTRSIAEWGEMFMMVGAVVLGLSILILMQEATGIGSE